MNWKKKFAVCARAVISSGKVQWRNTACCKTEWHFVIMKFSFGERSYNRTVRLVSAPPSPLPHPKGWHPHPHPRTCKEKDEYHTPVAQPGKADSQSAHDLKNIINFTSGLQISNLRVLLLPCTLWNCITWADHSTKRMQWILCCPLALVFCS